MIISDAWLLELSRESEGARQIARVLLTAQITAFTQTGHILDLSQELPHQRIRERALHGMLWRGYCRCLRCGNIALLADWCSVGALSPEARQTAIALTPKKARKQVAYLDACPGENVAVDIGTLLDVDVEKAGK